MTKPIEITIRKLQRKGCQPCVALGHMLAENAGRLAELNTTVSEHDIDEEYGLIRKYDLRGLPTMIFERNGAVMTSITGYTSFDEIVDAIEYAKEAR